MWNSFKVNSKTYFIHILYENESLVVRLTDLTCSWKEDLSIDAVGERFKELNSIDGDVESVKIIDALKSDLVPEKSEVAKSICIENDKCFLQLTSSDKDITFKFILSLSSSEEFYQDITFPLLLIIRELNERQDKMKTLLEKKDEEIAEYKVEGAKLFRPYLETKKFVIQDFLKECDNDMESQSIASASNIFSEKVNPLYFSVLKTDNNVKKEKTISKPVESITQRLCSEKIPVKWELGSQNCKRLKTNKQKLKF